MSTRRAQQKVNLSSSIDEHRKIQARIRALQKRANSLNEDLSRSSFGTKAAIDEIQTTYDRIIEDFNEQRQQLLRRVQHLKKNIQQSTNQLESARHNLNTARSTRFATRSNVEDLNLVVVETEEILSRIARQLKEVRLTTSRSPSRKLVPDRNESILKEKQNDFFLEHSLEFDDSTSLEIFARKTYVIELDILPQWTIGTIDKRIFLCDVEGEIRIFSYYRPLQRAALLCERFHLSTKRLITAFTITQDYLISFESDTKILSLHTHHGALLIRLPFLSGPLMMSRVDFRRRNEIWICERNEKRCVQIKLDHNRKQTNLVEKLDFRTSNSNGPVDPRSISTDGKNRIAIHDVNPTSFDRLVIFENDRKRFSTVDLVPFHKNPFSSSIERVLLVPNYENLLLLIISPDRNSSRSNEILLVDFSVEPNFVRSRIVEPNGIESLDLTLNGEFVYATKSAPNDRIPSKMHIFSFS